MEDKLIRALYRVSSRVTLYQLKQSFSALGFFQLSFSKSIISVIDAKYPSATGFQQ